MPSRRKFISAVPPILLFPLPLSKATATVTGTIDAKVYWISARKMGVIGKKEYAGYAEHGGPIYLNEDKREYVTTPLLLHEYGHVLRLTHRDTGLMSPDHDEQYETVLSGPPFDEATREICAKCDITNVIDWTDDTAAKETLATIARSWHTGKASTMTYKQAGRQFANGTGEDIYVTSMPDGIDMVEANTMEHQFFR